MKKWTTCLLVILAISLGLAAQAKTAPTYMTAEKREIARENIARYSWAEEESQSFKYWGELALYYTSEDAFWSKITSQELPRAASITRPIDPLYGVCPYCGKDIVSVYGVYPWLYNGENYPWKLQCPDCRRRFPTNDFGKFYQAGLDAHGFFDYETALANGSQYLTNDQYPEKGENWGIDDGYGWLSGEEYSANGQAVARRYAFIAYYNHWEIWYPSGSVQTALANFATAYSLTGDLTYGRAGAILLDRIADVYPDLFVGEFAPDFYNVSASSATGRALGSVFECTLSYNLAKYYDYLYPVFDDPTVIEFLSAKAEKYQLGSKSTAAQIRQNIENGILRQVLDGVSTENIKGDPGMHHASATMAALVLDSTSETTKVLDWLTGDTDIQAALARRPNSVPIDNTGSFSNLELLCDTLPWLYERPEVLAQLKANFPLTLAGRSTASIGDSGTTVNSAFEISTNALIHAFMRTEDPEIAQFLYFANGDSTIGLHADIYTSVDQLADKIESIVEQRGEYPRSDSSVANGFFALRAGVKKTAALGTVNTQRDFWMHFGENTNRGHADALNLGIDAYGLDLAPDMGQPESSADTARANWIRSTVAHNTVQVNDKPQTRISGGTPLHFNDSGFVRVMDASATDAYTETEEYRRTVIMVNYDDEISYGVDLFRIIGGDSHTYSFHAMSDTVFETENLTLTDQASGTYAGESVALGYQEESGYDALYDVKRAETPTREFAVDFEISDPLRLLDSSHDVHLRMTMLNDFDSEVALAAGQPPQINDNPSELQFLLARREGSDLDSLFTTVFEPYDTTRYIASAEQVSIVPTGGETPASTDTAKAVKITLANGRVDYVIYATNNQTEYLVDSHLAFRGFVGVVSMEDDIIVQGYLHDGSLLGDTTSSARFLGFVSDFTMNVSSDNYLYLVPEQEDFDVNSLRGQTFFLEDNAYLIEDAAWHSDSSIRLDVGAASFINGIDDSGYTHVLAIGQELEIPLTESWSYAPVISPLPDLQITKGDVYLELPLNATSPIDQPLTYELIDAPSGCTIDAERGVLSVYLPSVAQPLRYLIKLRVSSGTLSTTAYCYLDVSSGTRLLSIVNGAQIRTTGTQGLRFIASISKTTEEFPQVTEYGMLLIPSDDLTSISQLTLGATLNGHAVAKVQAVNLYDVTDSANTYTAVITNIKEKNYARSYTARAYAILENGAVVYSAAGTKRSIYEVACAAIQSSSESETNKAIFQKIIDTVESA